MAGIGFELSKIIDSEQGLLHTIKSYGFAGFVINGPMILCILAISIIQLIRGGSAYSGFSSNQITMVVSSAFVVSTLLISGFALVLTRYVSDCIYNENLSKVMPSLYGAMALSGMVSIAFTSILVLLAGMKLEHAVPVSSLYAIVNIIYLEMIYLSAVRKYKTVVAGFLAGNVLSVVLVLLDRYIDPQWAFQYILFCFNIGFAFTAALLLYQIRKPFGEGSGGLMEWTCYFKKYPSLSLINLFYYVSLYFVIFFYRFKDHNGFVAGFLTMKPEIDIPFYCASLGFIPGLVYLTVRFETALYTSCRDFYWIIANNGTYEEIDFKLKNLITTVKGRYVKMVSIAAVVLLLMILLSFALMNMGYSSLEQYKVYWTLAIAMNATLLMYASNIVLLYFDARSFSLIVNSFYMVLNITLTLLVDSQVFGSRCLGFMGASIVSMFLAMVIMLFVLKNLKNSAFVMKV